MCQESGYEEFEYIGTNLFFGNVSQKHWLIVIF